MFLNAAFRARLGDGAALPGYGYVGFSVFLLLLGCAISVIWSVNYLTLTDIPQHAAQMTGLRDIILGQFKWDQQAGIELNLTTLYLAAYIPGALLCLFMPVSVAIQVILTCALLAFVGLGIIYRRRFGGDPRLDFLLIPPFFGFAWEWGMVTFLLSAPLFFIFILKALDYAQSPTTRGSIIVLLLGTVLLFAHSLVFAFSCYMGGMLLLIYQLRNGFWRIVGLSWPYYILAALIVGHSFFVANHHAPENGIFLDSLGLLRFFQLIISQAGAGIFGGLNNWTILDYFHFTANGFMILLPFLISRIGKSNKDTDAAINIFFLYIAFFLIAPHMLVLVFLIYQRFAIYLLPVLLPLFSVRMPEGRTQKVVRWALPAVCAGIIIWQGFALRVTNNEVEGYWEIAQEMQPGERAFKLMFDSQAHLRSAYPLLHIPLWYQAEQGGWVDYNFACNAVQVLRYKVYENCENWGDTDWFPQEFNWQKHQGNLYRYFIVRLKPSQSTEDADRLLKNNFCEVALLKASGQWRLYERKSCRD